MSSAHRVRQVSKKVVYILGTGWSTDYKADSFFIKNS